MKFDIFEHHSSPIKSIGKTFWRGNISITKILIDNRRAQHPLLHLLPHRPPRRQVVFRDPPIQNLRAGGDQSLGFGFLSLPFFFPKE